MDSNKKVQNASIQSQNFVSINFNFVINFTLKQQQQKRSAKSHYSEISIYKL